MLREVMPLWVGWLGPAAFAGAIVVWVTFVPVMVLSQVGRALRAERPWTERAVLAAEGRLAIVMGAVLWIPLAVGLPGLFVGSFSRVPGPALVGVAAAVGMGVSLYAGWRFIRRDLGQPVPPFGPYLALLVRRWWPGAALVGLGFLAPSRVTSWWMIPWTVAALAGLFGLRYLAEAWTAVGVARPAAGRLEEAVARAAARFDSAPPRAFVLRTHAANALALPVRNLIIFTERLVGLLDDEELEAIALHEIAHLNERRAVTRLRAVGTLVYLPFLALRPLIGSGIYAVALAFLGGFGLRFLLMRVSKAEEARADSEAVERAHGSRSLGTALLKIHKAALVPAFTRRDPHGPLHERLERAGVALDFEPVRAPLRTRRLAVAGTLALVLIVGATFSISAIIDPRDGAAGSHVALAFGWNEEEVLWHTGYLATEDGDFERALPYLEEAALRGQVDALAVLPWVLGVAGRCDDVAAARDALVAAGGQDSSIDLADLWVDLCAET